MLCKCGIECKLWVRILFAPDSFSGGLADWIRSTLGVRYSYEFELRDRGHFGFLLPANYVLPVGEEAWSAVRVIVVRALSEVAYNVTNYVTTSGHVTQTDEPDWLTSKSAITVTSFPVPMTTSCACANRNGAFLQHANFCLLCGVVVLIRCFCLLFCCEYSQS